MAPPSRSGALRRDLIAGCTAGLIALTPGCSSERGGGNVAGSGGADAGLGASGSGGVPADGGVTAPGSDAGGTFSTLDIELQTEACREYVAAWCDRHVDCELWQELERTACMQAVETCPDRFFLPGSSYTVQSLNACRDDWHTFSCERLARAERPDCIQRGTGTEGASCGFTTQCASGLCSALNGECGVCLDLVESGARCQSDMQCPSGLLCSFGHCLQQQAWSSADSLGDGEPCAYDGRCQGLCAPTEQGPRCVPVPPAGTPCIAAPPELGARRCQRTHYCSEDELCLPLPAQGEACAPGLRPCQSGNYCDSSDGFAPGICHAWLQPGTACDPAIHDARFACRERTRCRCIDAACSSGVCAYAGGETHSCADGETCEAGTECVAGTCRMVYREALCGP